MSRDVAGCDVFDGVSRGVVGRCRVRRSLSDVAGLDVLGSSLGRVVGRCGARRHRLTPPSCRGTSPARRHRPRLSPCRPLPGSSYRPFVGRRDVAVCNLRRATSRFCPVVGRRRDRCCRQSRYICGVFFVSSCATSSTECRGTSTDFVGSTAVEV